MTSNATSTPQSRPERQSVFWFYGSASTVSGITNNAFSYLLLVYANQVLGLPGYIAAAALALTIFWDAVSDLIIGHLSDKTKSRLGRRHPYMYASLLVLPLAFYSLFNPGPYISETTAFAHLLIVSILIRTGTTLFEVPSVSLLPELEKDYDRRNKWLALRHLFGWYGGIGIHAANFAFWVGEYGIASQDGYSIYGTVGALIIAAVMIVSTTGTQSAASKLQTPTEPFKWSRIAREVGHMANSLRNRNLAALFSYSVLAGIAIGLSNALYIYNTTYFFEFTGKEIAFTAVAVAISPVIAYIFAPRVGRRFGKKRGAIIASLGNLSLFPIPYVLAINGYWPAYGSTLSLYLFTTAIVIEVVFYIISAVLIDSMMADIVEESEVRTNRRSEGLFYAARGFANKAISAGGIISAGTIISLSGLDEVKSVAQMTDEIRYSLTVLFVPAYVIIILISLVALSVYRLNRNDHNANLETLAQRRRNSQ